MDWISWVVSSLSSSILQFCHWWNPIFWNKIWECLDHPFEFIYIFFSLMLISWSIISPWCFFTFSSNSGWKVILYIFALLGLQALASNFNFWNSFYNSSDTVDTFGLSFLINASVTTFAFPGIFWSFFITFFIPLPFLISVLHSHSLFKTELLTLILILLSYQIRY